MRFCVGHYSLNMKKCVYWLGGDETFTEMHQLADTFTLLLGLNGFVMLLGRKKLQHTSGKSGCILIVREIMSVR